MKIILPAILSTALLAALASCGGSSSTSQPPAPAASTTTAVSTPSPTPSPISAAQQTFASAMQNDFNFSTYISTDEFVNYGETICADRQNGRSQLAELAFTRNTFVNTSRRGAASMVRLAERDLCPKYLAAVPPPPPPPPPPKPVVLVSMSGNGIQNSAPVNVTQSTLTVTYSYDCSSFGGSGNFIADFISGDPNAGNYDDQQIANQLGSGGSVTTTIYPQNVPGQYHLEVNSECSWSVTITQPPS
jgi:hypothetical protein